MTGYADGAAAWMALPAHLYCLWGELSSHEMPHRHTYEHAGHHLECLSSPGHNNARIFAEAIWWEKNAAIYSHLVLIYLHLHKDIGMTQIMLSVL